MYSLFLKPLHKHNKSILDRNNNNYYSTYMKVSLNGNIKYIDIYTERVSKGSTDVQCTD